MRLQSILTSALVVLTASASLSKKTTTTQLKCITEYGTSKVKHVPSSTATLTINLPNVIVYTTTTVTLKTTLPASTVTSTQTTTSVATVTASLVTDVFSTTSTIFTTTTSSSYVSTTTTVTDPVNTVTTTVTTTSTVPTSSGFLPVADTTNSAYPGQKKAKRLVNPHGSSISERNALSLGCKGSQYPECVECVKKVEVWQTQLSVITAKKTSTISVTPKPSTQTVTTTAISTSTVVPADVSTTLSFTTTSTVSTSTVITSTFTSTTTNTITVTSTTSSYAACGTSNLLTAVVVDGNSYGVDNYFNNGNSAGTNYNSVDSDDAYGCCVQCQEATVCDAFVFAGSGQCLIITNPNGDSYGAQCGPQSSGPGYYTYNSGGSNYVVGNGNCGYAYQGPEQ